MQVYRDQVRHTFSFDAEENLRDSEPGAYQLSWSGLWRQNVPSKSRNFISATKAALLSSEALEVMASSRADTHRIRQSDIIDILDPPQPDTDGEDDDSTDESLTDASDSSTTSSVSTNLSTCDQS